MMGQLNRDQEQLFYSFRLDDGVPDDHLVRAIAAVLDLSWVHAELASSHFGYRLVGASTVSANKRHHGTRVCSRVASCSRQMSRSIGIYKNMTPRIGKSPYRARI
jgi:hypothetical protein